MTHRSDLIASDFVAIVPSDTTPLALRGLYVGTGGDVAVKGAGGVAVTFKNVPSGTTLTGHMQAVMSTNTTASNLVGYSA